MPAAIIDALVNFLDTYQTPRINTWEGEVPRFDPEGTPISPTGVPTGSNPKVWPIVRCLMSDQGFGREWNVGVDPYTDTGEILTQVYGVTRASVESQMNIIETLFVSATNWRLIEIPVLAPLSVTNPPYVIGMLLKRWCSVQEENVRLAGSQFCYRGDIWWKVMIHGAVSTR